MQGFHLLVDAMVLQAVEELSDDGQPVSSQAVPETVPKPAPKPKVAPKTKGKAEPKGGKKRPAASPDAPDTPPLPMKRPASKTAAKAKAKAAKADEVKIGKSYYKDADRYGFKVNGAEVFYVT